MGGGTPNRDVFVPQALGCPACPGVTTDGFGGLKDIYRIIHRFDSSI